MLNAGFTKKKKLFDTIDEYENQKITQQTMSRAGNCQCSGRLSSKALISDDPLLHSAERDDSIENLRNPQPIFFEESYSIQDRLYDVNIFNGCIHKDYLHRSLRNSFGRPRYSESEKDTYYAVKESDEPIRQQIRTRSESEPSDIRNMNKWRIRSQFKLPLNDVSMYDSHSHFLR